MAVLEEQGNKSMRFTGRCKSNDKRLISCSSESYYSAVYVLDMSQNERVNYLSTCWLALKALFVCLCFCVVCVWDVIFFFTAVEFCCGDFVFSSSSCQFLKTFCFKKSFFFWGYYCVPMWSADVQSLTASSFLRPKLRLLSVWASWLNMHEIF